MFLFDIYHSAENSQILNYNTSCDIQNNFLSRLDLLNYLLYVELLFLNILKCYYNLIITRSMIIFILNIANTIL